LVKRQCLGEITDDTYWITQLHLKESDRDILEENKELNDRLMDAASVLLKRKFPEVQGLQSTLLIGNSQHCMQFGNRIDSMQLIHQGIRRHWIASYMNDSQLYIYDSMQPTICTQVLPDTSRVIE
jgi:hypothetical protein